MPNTTAIIFSKNRACQLDALLASLRSNLADWPLAVDVTVIWAATDDHYAVGYARCMTDHPDVRFIYEQDFAADYRNLLNGKYVIHFVDDDILFRRVNLAHPVWEMERSEELLTFSLRLGLNTVYCYSLDAPQAVPITSYAQPPIVSWRWVAAEHDFGYPFSLDGHLLRVDEVRSLIENVEFSNPNELEQGLAERAYRFSDRRRRMASYSKSHLVGVPANVVSATHRNRNEASYSPRELNGAYCDGARINIHAMDFSGVNAAHANVPYAWTGKAMAA